MGSAFTVLQSPPSGNNLHRLQVTNAGKAIMFSSSDKGTNWNDTNVLTEANIQAGTLTVHAAASGATEFSVIFPRPFTKLPTIITTTVTSRPDLRSSSPSTRSYAGFTGSLYNGSTESNIAVFWIAYAI